MKEGDYVKTYAEVDASYEDSGIVVKLGAGHIGRILEVRECKWFDNDILVSFSGNRYWMKSRAVRLVEVLDEMGGLL